MIARRLPVLGLVLAAMSGVALAAPTPLTYRTFHYTCDAGKAVDVAYVKVDTEPMFAVLTWNGARYGLAQATSASGARYAALYGGPNNAGLEWWEHQGQGTLSTFVGGAFKTSALLTGCRVR